jgi:hypothetical protein
MLTGIPEDLVLESVKRRLGGAAETSTLYVAPNEIPILINVISQYLKLKAVGEYLETVDLNQYKQ